jgi:hypothetical protein
VALQVDAAQPAHVAEQGLVEAHHVAEVCGVADEPLETVVGTGSVHRSPFVPVGAVDGEVVVHGPMVAHGIREPAARHAARHPRTWVKTVAQPTIFTHVRARSGCARAPVPHGEDEPVKYAEHILDLVGNTPLVKLNSVTDGIAATVLGKVEYLNPGGSVKDRIALAMVEAAEASGALKPGGVIVEPTSGNTGVGLALVAQRKGYSCIFVCPDKVSEDKRNVLKAYGAQVVVCPTSVPPEHPDSYYSTSDRLVRETTGAWKPDQYSNPNGPLSHYASTGPEIWGRHRRSHHPLRHRGGHGRNDLGCGSLPA